MSPRAPLAHCITSFLGETVAGSHGTACACLARQHVSIACTFYSARRSRDSAKRAGSTWPRPPQATDCFHLYSGHEAGWPTSTSLPGSPWLSPWLRSYDRSSRTIRVGSVGWRTNRDAKLIAGAWYSVMSFMASSLVHTLGQMTGISGHCVWMSSAIAQVKHWACMPDTPPPPWCASGLGFSGEKIDHGTLLIAIAATLPMTAGMIVPRAGQCATDSLRMRGWRLMLRAISQYLMIFRALAPNFSPVLGHETLSSTATTLAQ